MTYLPELLDLALALADDRPRLALMDEESDLDVLPLPGASFSTVLHNTSTRLLLSTLEDDS